MKTIPDIAWQDDTLLAPEIDFLFHPIANQALLGKGLEILDIRAECDRSGIAKIDSQYLAVVAAELPDWASGSIDLIRREARRLLVVVEANEGDRKLQ